MKITSKPKYICKQVGILLLIIGSTTFLLQIIFELIFPLLPIIFGLSLVFQIIGWNEPVFFLTDKWIKNKNEK